MTRLTIIILASLMVLACDHSNSIDEDQKKLIIKEVTQTFVNYFNNIRESGLNAELQYLDNSADFFWVPPGYSDAITYDSVVAILKQNASRYRSIDNDFESLQILPLTQQLTTYTGRLHSIMTDTSGNVIDIRLIETGVLVKRNDGWKLLSGHTSLLSE